MTRNYLPFVLLVFLNLAVASCSNSGKVNKITTDITQHKFFPKLSSASGVEVINKKIMFVGDDLPFLFTLDEQWNVIKKQKISGIDSIVNGRTPKSLKADFESIAVLVKNGRPNYLIMSSGSEIVTRDTAFLVPIHDDGTVIKKNMRPLYDVIKQKASLNSTNEINIEGLAFSHQNAYLMHRGNVSENFIVELDLSSFLDFLVTENQTIPEMNIYNFNLPRDEKVSSGFSGACFLPELNGLLFTASLESTTNEIDDGAILGSYIGFIGLPDLKTGDYHAELITQNGKTLLKKQEGITVKSKDGNKYQVLTVCDNDDGSSDLFEIVLTINQE